MPVFQEFYAADFPRLRRHSNPDPLAARVVQAAVDAGMRTVLATNPLYPRAAIVERLEWAGISPDLFDLITTYEHMHFCKPRPEYYREICSIIGCEPHECLMVGNDVDEDLVAAGAGMKTFLVNTAVRNRNSVQYVADYEGSLADLLDLIQGGGL
ncbi:MAG: HAD family hydrolase [Firmicutes bacterium]|nr:HAD family hydrolase [Bacillota bacterium]